MKAAYDEAHGFLSSNAQDFIEEPTTAHGHPKASNS